MFCIFTESIYNFDESGIFYRKMSNKTFCFKDNESKGAKNSKERIIVAFLTNAIGEKENILVIGKSAKPNVLKI